MRQINQKPKEVNKMKKIVMITFLMALSVVMMYGMADAISGVCSSCHTMHDSQDGAAVATSGPNGLLLKSSGCLGCHTGAGIAGAPIVDKNTMTDVAAGGTFNDTIATDDSMRHDVADIVGITETALVANGTPGNGGDSVITVAPNALTCAGATGCHGNNTAGMDSNAGIRGSHHATNATYRFLWIGTDMTTPVLGEGEGTWEQTSASNTKHNVYSAHATQGISSLCNKCHGEFHGTTETTATTGSPWKRHPTDYKLFGGAGTAQWATGSVTLDYKYPVGLVSIGANTTTTDYYGTPSAEAAVICLSCHRAHGSDQADLLRFDYTDMVAGDGATTGCLGCHYKQQ